MTLDEAKEIVSLAVGTDKPQAEDIAEAHISKAVLKFARANNTNFNRKWATGTLTSGKSSYVVGAEIFSGYSEIQKVQYLWRTDVPGWPISVIGLEAFNRRARGSTTSGPPVVATIHSDKATLELYPIPDSAYTIAANLKKKITGWADIPSYYQDIVVDYAVASVMATRNAEVAVQLLKAGLDDMKYDSIVGWTGDQIPLLRHITEVDDSNTADSGNLVGF